ncbi:MAG: capsular polysaccharide synthesis protein [Minisyncoccia bacterium]
MNIWSYWEGPRLPYIDTCIRSMQAVYGNDFHLVTPETVDEYIPQGTLHPHYERLDQPALKADCVRAALLALRGGWWFDADTIALPGWPPSKADSAWACYMTWQREPIRVLNGYIGMGCDCPVGAIWLEQVNQTLAARSPDWCTLGERILTPLLYGKTEPIWEIPRRLCLPIDIDSNVAAFMRPGSPRDYLHNDTLCFGLNHSWMLYHHPAAMQMLPNGWAKSPLLIHRLLTYAQERFG